MTTTTSAETSVQTRAGNSLTSVGRKPMNGEAMSQRTFRSTDAAWEAAKATAEANGEELSDELRKFLDRYSKRKRRTPPPSTTS